MDLPLSRRLNETYASLGRWFQVDLFWDKKGLFLGFHSRRPKFEGWWARLVVQSAALGDTDLEVEPGVGWQAFEWLIQKTDLFSVLHGLSLVVEGSLFNHFVLLAKKLFEGLVLQVEMRVSFRSFRRRVEVHEGHVWLAQKWSQLRVVSLRRDFFWSGLFRYYGKSEVCRADR